MSRRVTIVTYHFVRDLKRSRFPAIKGLDIAEFVEQIEFIRRHYSLITMEQLIWDATSGGGELPPNAALLTFDDGYIDHFVSVFPLLEEHGIQGSFFPPAAAVLDHRILDVNKIHFVLAAVDDKASIIRFINSAIAANSAAYVLESPAAYYERLAVPSRFDTAEVVFIKRVLQRDLPQALRSTIVADLFTRFVSRDEKAFAAELYVNKAQLRLMRNSGMHVGSHGFNHCWMNSLSAPEQADEIDRSLEFLGSLGCDVQNWTMCYPYGAYDASLMEILRQRRCAIGLTTDVAIANLAVDDRLTLPRLDTNDLPKARDAQPALR